MRFFVHIDSCIKIPQSEATFPHIALATHLALFSTPTYLTPAHPPEPIRLLPTHPPRSAHLPLLTHLDPPTPTPPRPGSVVVERSPGMREVGGSIPGRLKQKTLKFEVLLLCLALSTKELEAIWPARSQNNGLGWDITAYPWGGVSVG